MELAPDAHEHERQTEVPAGLQNVDVLDQMAHPGRQEQDEGQPPGASLPSGKRPGDDERAESREDGDRRRLRAHGERERGVQNAEMRSNRGEQRRGERRQACQGNAQGNEPR